MKAKEQRSAAPARNADNQLGPCPRCGKPEGVLKDGGSGRFRYYAICDRKDGVALKLWNKAKLAPKRDRHRV